MEDRRRHVVHSLLYAFVSSGLVSVLIYLFMTSVPVEYLTDLIEYFAENPGIICSAIFTELLLIIFILEVFRIVFDSGKRKVVRSTAKKAPKVEKKPAAKKATTKVAAKTTKKTTKK